VFAETDDAEDYRLRAPLGPVVIDVIGRKLIILTYLAPDVLMGVGRNVFGAIWAEHLGVLLQTSDVRW
jgi:hypothetical protein